jgi:hypothetical protein
MFKSVSKPFTEKYPESNSSRFSRPFENRFPQRCVERDPLGFGALFKKRPTITQS